MKVTKFFAVDIDVIDYSRTIFHTFMKYLTLLVFICLLSGCSTPSGGSGSGGMYSIDDSDTYDLGKPQVLEMYGEPSSISIKNGNEEWFYKNAGGQANLVMVFNQEGKLVSLSQN